jgi:hypothetical protein
LFFWGLQVWEFRGASVFSERERERERPKREKEMNQRERESVFGRVAELGWMIFFFFLMKGRR